MLFKKIVTTTLSLAVALSMIPSFIIDTEASSNSDVFFDDFNGTSLDTTKWLIANKKWGGNNGGVIEENVSVSNGTLKLEGHGLNYTGNVPGIGREDGKLTGAAIATRDYYASGSYEVVAKIAPDLGACSALWTFEYEEYYPGDEEFDPKYAMGGNDPYCTVNHEIDIEIPTATGKNPDPNFSSARFNTYRRENQYTPKYYDLGISLDDGQYHTYRFDWHTGDNNETARVEFYIDGHLYYTSFTNIPTNEGRFWIGLWFPCSVDSDKDGKADSGWAGKANFDTTVFEIDSVKITPFHESGDTEQHETYAYDGWANSTSFPELGEKENFEHIMNGNFQEGDKYWTLKGDAIISDSHAVLTSGEHTDSVNQVVNVLPATTYTITADIITDGTKVLLGASKENGGNNQYIEITESGKVTFTFTNDTVNTTIKVYVKVERWQGSKFEVTVDNISMKGLVVETPSDSSTPTPTEGTSDTPTAIPTGEDITPTSTPTIEINSPSVTPTSNPNNNSVNIPTSENTTTPTPTKAPEGTNEVTNTGTNSTPVIPIEVPTSTPVPTPTDTTSKDIGDFVNRCYKIALGRDADDIGYHYWVDNLNNGKACGAQVGYGFIFSEEYINKNRTNEEFIIDLYLMYFDRPYDEGGFQYWLNMLNEGASREHIFAGFANSEEFYNLCTEFGVTQGLYLEGVDNTQQGGINCFVARLYKVCFNRLPDIAGQAGWVLKLYNGEVTGTSCSYGFIFSPEFIGKNPTNEEFVKYMYAAFFGREADNQGFDSWVAILNNGGSFQDVFDGFTGSQEFINLCEAYGIKA